MRGILLGLLVTQTPGFIFFAWVLTKDWIAGLPQWSEDAERSLLTKFEGT